MKKIETYHNYGRCIIKLGWERLELLTAGLLWSCEIWEMHYTDDKWSKRTAKKPTVPPLAPEVVIREMQFFTEGFSRPSDSKSLRTFEFPVLSLSWLVIFLSNDVSADSPLLEIVFSIFSCSVIGSGNQIKQVPK